MSVSLLVVVGLVIVAVVWLVTRSGGSEQP